MKEYILEALVGHENIAISVNIPDDVIESGTIVNHILSQAFITDTDGLITVFPHKFDLLCVYSAPVEMTLVGEEGEE